MRQQNVGIGNRIQEEHQNVFIGDFMELVLDVKENVRPVHARTAVFVEKATILSHVTAGKSWK